MVHSLQKSVIMWLVTVTVTMWFMCRLIATCYKGMCNTHSPRDPESNPACSIILNHPVMGAPLVLFWLFTWLDCSFFAGGLCLGAHETVSPQSSINRIEARCLLADGCPSIQPSTLQLQRFPFSDSGSANELCSKALTKVAIDSGVSFCCIPGSGPWKMWSLGLAWLLDNIEQLSRGGQRKGGQWQGQFWYVLIRSVR